MATRMKTVEYWFPLYTSTVTDLTDTTLTQITLYLPESSKTFNKVTADCTFHDQNTTLSGNIDRRQLSIQLGSAGYSVVNNATADQIGQCGEAKHLQFVADFTSYFTTNWSGTSMTCDCKFLADSDITPTPLGFINVSVRLRITYEYDDTSATHVKTVWLPLDAPTGALGTTKPGSATATIPQLTGSGSPLLPEASPTVRQVAIVVQGNAGANASATDRSYTIEVDSLGTQVTGTYEFGDGVDPWIRFHQVQSFDTTASRSFYLWSSLASLNSAQVYMVVTYEFTVSGTTTLLNSVWLAMSNTNPMGGTTSSDYQRHFAELWIEEPTTITTKYLAAYMTVTASATIAGTNWRLGTGSFIAYTDNTTQLAGTRGVMIRNDSAFSLARGRNQLTVDGYRTDTTDLGWLPNGFLIVVYTSGVPSGGPGAANHTVFWNILTHGTGAGGGNLVVSATNPTIPETDYFLSQVGVEDSCILVTTSLGLAALNVERLSAEGGVGWDEVYSSGVHTDGEVGMFPTYAIATSFKQWPSDNYSLLEHGRGRFDVETARRWRVIWYNTTYHGLSLMLTYHTITFTKSITVGGYGGTGTGLTVELFNLTKNMKVGEFTTTTGSCTAKWYDSVDTYFATCREDSTHVGRSDNFSLT